ncbi:alpha/beta fold hydrolase [Paenibacillus lutimineralis]|uniref:Alpha/beta fold hydrolase n=2 Tax=Paenibacillus lutimineralis TaxID=2707005 RepID=A0A3S9UV12_9BACL|nr:alpha/beta fold hydrolase [Paenibacillus lutimineralis]
MSSYSRMQLLQMVENGQLSPEEALSLIRGNQRMSPDNTQEDPPDAAPSGLAGQIRQILVEGVATLLKVPAAKIDLDTGWSSFGFDSISFTGFQSYLAEKLKVDLSMNVFLEYGTINELGEHLLEQTPSLPAATADLAPAYAHEAAGTAESPRVVGSQVAYSAGNVRQTALDKSMWQKTDSSEKADTVPVRGPEVGQNHLRLISSSDQFFTRFWQELGSQKAFTGSYRSYSLEELEEDRHKYIQLLVGTSSGKSMEVVVSGKGSPLVLVGGVGMASPMVLKQFEHFSQKHKVICIHNPGCGLSEDIEDYTLEGRARIIAEVLDGLGVKEPVDFIGFSWGGLLGQTFSVMYPKRISRLVLVSSIYEIVNENPKMNADEAMRLDLEAVPGGEDYSELMECGKSIDQRIFTKYMEYYLPGNQKSYSTMNILRQIQAPVLIVFGRNDTIINTRQSKVMGATIPGAAMLELEDAAHFLFMTHHKQLNLAVEDFLVGNTKPHFFSLKECRAQMLEFERCRLAELQIAGLEEYDGLEERLNNLCTSYAFRFLKDSGIDVSAGAIHDRNEWAMRLRLPAAYTRLLDCMIDMLAEDRIVKLMDSRVKFVADESTVPDPKVLYEACLESYPEFKGMLSFLDYCVGKYQDALTGKIPPVSVLFPKGSSDALEQSNRDTVEHGRERVYAGVVHDTLSLLIDAGEGAEINILEVGGGTGLLTRQLLPLAARANVNYWFTDIGEYFIGKARQNPEFASLNFKTFDITKDPEAQGFTSGSFDAVLGLNVVHATKDIQGTVDNLKPLLAPGGIMMLIEACKRQRWVDMVWGLAEGWWVFEDLHLRQKSPIIDPYAWEKVLAASDFREFHVFPEKDNQRFTADCVIAAAQYR